MAPKPKLQQKDNAARVHGGQSNRRTKDRGVSKTVFKSVLANPFEVKWPVVPSNVQTELLARIVELVQGVAEYNLSRHQRSRATRSVRRAQKRAKYNNTMEADATQQDNEIVSGPSTAATTTASAPEILKTISVGINEVTKRLEQQCRIPRQIVSHAETDDNAARATTGGDEAGGEMMDDTAAPNQSARPDAARASIRAVFVCRSDVDPPLLVAHIPYLVAACNSATRDPTALIKLISLPKGAESSLSLAMGLQRVSVLAFDETISSRDATLSSLLPSIETVFAPWLAGIADSPLRSASNPKTTPPKRAEVLLRRRLEPTHIKQLRTTAPKDMRAAKALRAKGRAEAKANRKAKEETKKLDKKHEKKTENKNLML